MTDNPITELYVDNGNEFIAIDPKTVARAVEDQTNESEVQKFIDGGIKGWDEVKTGNEFVAASFVHENFNNLENKYDILDSNSMRFIGEWDATEQVDFSGIELPVKRGYVYKIIGTETTIDNIKFTPGNFIVIKRYVSKPGTIDTSDVEIIGAGGNGGLPVDHLVLDAFETKADLNNYVGGLPNCIVIVANDEDHHGYLSFYNYLEGELTYNQEVNTYEELMSIVTLEVIPQFQYDLDSTSNIITLNTYIDSLLDVPAPRVNYIEYGYIVKVITDESREGLTTYYKWNGKEWIYIGNTASKWYYMFSHIDPISLEDANRLINEVASFRNDLNNRVTYNDFYNQMDYMYNVHNNDINRIENEIAGIDVDNFATKNDLNSYTTKTYADQTYATKEEVSLIPHFDIQVVSELPTEDISTTTIYLISADSSSLEDLYNEYIYVNNNWELIGSGRIDSLTWGNITGTLSNQTDLQDALDNKQDTLISGTNIKTINGNSILGSGDIEVGGVLPELATVATTGEYVDLLNTPTIPNSVSDLSDANNYINVMNTTSVVLSTVATSGDYNDLTNTPTIPVIPTLANVATSGDYNDLTNIPAIPVLVQSDWNETDTSSMAFILNKPTIPAGVIVDQNYDPLSNNAQSGVAVANAIANKVDNSSLAIVATSGDYNDLTNTPIIPSSVQSDWNETDMSSMAFILNKPTIPVIPTLSTVATTGDYNDLTNIPNLATVATTGEYVDLLNTPTIPNSVSDLSDANNYINVMNTTSVVLANVATSGDYADLTNKPTIPAAQVQSDWNATTGMGVILNKPTLSTVATTGDYNDLTNIPTIPPSIVVDQTYNASSNNAQSGVAVAEAISNVFVSSSWGNITGTLSNQIDLQDALDDKSKVSIVNWNTSTTTDLDTLIINKLTKDEYDDLVENDDVNDNELYMVTDADTDYVRPSDLQSILDRLDVIEDAISNLTDRVEALEQGGGGSGVYEAQMTLQNVIESGEQPSIDTVEDEVNPILEDILGE